MTAVGAADAPPRAEYAGVVSRAGAFLVDAAVVAALAFGAVAVVALGTLVVGAQGWGIAQTMMSVYALVVPALLVMYNLVFWGLAGRTPGMALLGLRLVSTAGTRVRWLPSLVRALVLVLFPIGALWCLVDRRHQAVHDKVARTDVVRAPRHR